MTPDKNKNKLEVDKNKEQLDPQKNSKKMVHKTYFFNPQDKVFQIAQAFDVSSASLIQKLLQLGIKTDVNQTLNKETIKILANTCNVEFLEKPEENNVSKNQEHKEKNPVVKKESRTKETKTNLEKIPPIVVIMGHVDHGKTTLLDAIRKTRVVDQEFGGITQHIGAYQVDYQNNKITFIDTPGHEAFGKMRARGAQITNICILVVAVDDCVKPQTIEALKHAKKAQIPIIVALNKSDKPNNNSKQIMTELSSFDLLPEEWGGQTPYIPISALKKEGLDKLLETILLLSEIQDLKADLQKKGQGAVLEASLDKSLGPVATFMVNYGNLKISDVVVVGHTYGKIRFMEDENKKPLKKVLPSQPVRVAGLKDVPKAGDLFYVVANEKEARKIILEAKSEQQENLSKALPSLDLENILQNLEEEKPKELNIILKTDTQGSLEAICGMIEKINVSDLKVNLLRTSVGTVTEKDVILAESSQSLLIGFNVKPSSSILKLAQKQKIQIVVHNIIYRIIEDIEKRLKQMVKPVFEEVFTGQAEIRKIFHISKIGNIAGCYVTQGIVNNNDFAKVIRDGEVIFKGKINSLKRLKENIKSSKQGYECGILLDNFNDFIINDIIETSKLDKMEN
ncbi:translation initiation factor IF-2 [Candidatus Phytoplasma australiense]|uniref:Translation initiation factor IF-2 n=1 Tax=Strawberry lethal yellows phytoplasma (CPA) str. NZSb11 TaxID=980422 RepID=R4S0K5_PHYAS|nr:translation initiation factor IF-2 [Candidatus Phytoplasma australiense]AGL90334.1 Translation initiation factor IF-2 [Strawberry lethal yellows phytoplasma (CPA) str. NZSb11]